MIQGKRYTLIIKGKEVVATYLMRLSNGDLVFKNENKIYQVKKEFVKREV